MTEFKTPKNQLKGAWYADGRPPKCRECVSAERPHYARGYCQPCYFKVYKYVRARQRNPGRKPRRDPPRSLLLNPTKE